MKYTNLFFMSILVIILLVLSSCSQETANEATSTDQTTNPCGDGTCDSAEQADNSLCPQDCGASVTTDSSAGATKTSSEFSTTEDTSSYPSLADEFTFIVDTGIRMTEASNAGVRINDNGSVSLLFEDTTVESGSKQHIAVSDDGLTFADRGEAVTNDVGGQFRAKQLPDGTWRGYGYDTTKGVENNCLTSQSSTDGITYTTDEGCRYTLEEEDNGWMGVYDFFADSENNIVLLYLGDKNGLNNVRRAYSTDAGWNFTFTNGNVLGDEDLGGGSMSYVDEKVLVLEDHRIFLVAMQSGTIYGFMSDDDGVSFQRYKEALLTPEEFTDDTQGTAHSLHDPQIVQLNDGRYRIYVTALFNGQSESKDDDSWGLVSATTSE